MSAQLKGLALTIPVALMISSAAAAATPKWMRIITDADAANYLDAASIKIIKGEYRAYTSMRVATKPVTSNKSFPIRRPYNKAKCPCPYDTDENDNHCGGRASGKTICYAPSGTKSLLIFNSVDCRDYSSRKRHILAVWVMDSSGKQIKQYTGQQIAAGYPETFHVDDAAESLVIQTACRLGIL